MSDGFHKRKQAILVALNSDTPDKSPKGYVDEPLLPLIVLINNHPEYVTTSSCSGRICTYMEGLNESSEGEDTHDGDEGQDENGEEETVGFEENTSLQAVEASKRAKGGQWLYVSHDPVSIPSQDWERWMVETLFGPEAHRVALMDTSESHATSSAVDTARSQLVYFKFEPMILHIEATTLATAKTFLNHSLFSGYRNSGILPSAKRTMLAVRSTLKLDAPIAHIPAGSDEIHLIVSLSYLRVLMELSNDKFRENVRRMGRYEERLTKYLDPAVMEANAQKKGDQGDWEDKDARKERKRREGLERKRAKEEAQAAAAAEAAAESTIMQESVEDTDMQ